MKMSGLKISLRGNSEASLRLTFTLLCCFAGGCATSSGIRQGLEYQDRGEYIPAYRHFQKLARDAPNNREYIVYANTARRLAFRQCVGLAEKALAADDLDGFVEYMKQANEIQPSQRVRNVVEVVEGARERGKSDVRIRAELRAAMGLHAEEGTLKEALEKTAARIAEKIRSRVIKDPVSVLGITFGDTGKANTACVYFENELSAELVDKAVRVVERDNLEKIKKELQMSATSMIHEDQVLEIGKIAGAKSMITGNMFKWENGIKYQLRVFDVETSKVIFHDTETFYAGRGFDQMLKERP